jgi:hypothetical protein
MLDFTLSEWGPVALTDEHSNKFLSFLIPESYSSFAQYKLFTVGFVGRLLEGRAYCVRRSVKLCQNAVLISAFSVTLLVL